jgi:toxin YoeB
MRLEFKPQAFEDLQYWVQHQPKTAKRVMRMLQESMRDPFRGIGKPEPLKGDLSGWWSKQIDGEHRIVYKVEGDALIVAQARGHYG